MKMVSRSDSEKLEFLRRHLLVIESALRNAIDGQEEAHLDSMATAVYALIGRYETYPLLYELSEQFEFPLVVYGTQLDVFEEMLDAEIEILGSTAIKWAGDSARPDVSEPLYKTAMTLKDWMESTHLIINGRKWSGDKLLQQLRNKDGAHFDEKIPEDMAILRQFKIMGWSSQYQAIVPMGINVLALGQGLLKSLSDQHSPGDQAS